MLGTSSEDTVKRQGINFDVVGTKYVIYEIRSREVEQVDGTQKVYEKEVIAIFENRAEAKLYEKVAEQEILDDVDIEISVSEEAVIA
jgi:hypothetical protein